MSIKRILFFLIFGCCLSVSSSAFAAENVDQFLSTKVVPNQISWDDFYEGHYEGEYIGILAIGSADVWLDTYYVDITYSDGSYAQQITDKTDAGTYFRYDNWYCYGDHNDQGFVNLTNVQVGDIAALFGTDESGNHYIKEVYKCFRTCNGWNYGDLYDENWVDIGDLSGGSVMMYTCLEEQDKIYMTFWKEVNDFNSVFKAASLRDLAKSITPTLKGSGLAKGHVTQ